MWTPTALRTGLRTVSGPLLIDEAVVADSWITELPVPAPTPQPGPNPCGLLTYDPQNPPTYEHVIVLMEENLSYNRYQSSTDAPYIHGLGKQCGSEENMHAATHPSQPNYMAASSGIASPLGVKTDAANIFRQIQDAGLTWKSYQESMPSNCSSSNTGFYKSGHNPALLLQQSPQPEHLRAVRRPDGSWNVE